MSSIEIRQFNDGDRADVVELWQQCFPNDPPHNEPHSIIDRKLSINDGLFFVAQFEGKLGGTILAGYDGMRGWIYHLATHPDLRRKGIGRKLVGHVVSVLSEKGCVKINLQVRKSNQEVIDFYKKIGFTEDSVLSLGRLL